MLNFIGIDKMIFSLIQDFVVRNDSPCGSTIGPIMSAKLGMPTIDLGAPQLSMHSIREMCDSSSVKQSVDLYTVSLSLLRSFILGKKKQHMWLHLCK